jgi:hypothetical protein
VTCSTPALTWPRSRRWRGMPRSLRPGGTIGATTPFSSRRLGNCRFRTSCPRTERLIPRPAGGFAASRHGVGALLLYITCRTAS